MTLVHIEILGPLGTTINFTVAAEDARAATADIRNLGHEPLRAFRAYDPLPIGAWARDWADAHGLAEVGR